MVSVPGYDVITPFTTIASVSNMSLKEVADSANLPYDIVSTDYVAAKDTRAESSDASASQVHLVARTMVSQLGSMSENHGQSEELVTAGQNISEFVVNLDTDQHNPDEISLLVADNEVDGTQLRVSSEEGFYTTPTQEEEKEGAKLHHRYEASISQSFFRGDGVINWAYNTENNEVCEVLENGDLDDCADLNEEDDEIFDETIYVSRDLMLNVAIEEGYSGDVLVYTTYDLGNESSWQPWTQGMLEGKTWYFLTDMEDSFGPIDPELAERTFHEDGRVKDVILGGDEVGETLEGKWKLVDGKLVLEWLEDGQVTDTETYSYAPGNDDIFLAIHNNDDARNHDFDVWDTGLPALMIKEQTMAETIFKKWVCAAEMDLCEAE